MQKSVKISGTVGVSRRCKLAVRRETLSRPRSGTASDGLTCNCAKFFVCLITMVGVWEGGHVNKCWYCAQHSWARHWLEMSGQIHHLAV